MNKLAQIKLYDGDSLQGFGALGLQGKSAGESGSIFTTFISSTIGIITLVAVIWFVFVVLTGAIGMMTAGADKNALENGKKIISSGLIGLVVTISALFLVDFVGKLFGLDNMLNVVKLITDLTIK